MLTRVAALVAVLAVAVAVLAMMLRAPEYEVSLTVSNASQLVKGDQVKVGGVAVGSVRSLELSDDGQARIGLALDDEELTPLHHGTKGIIRSTSLAGIANRYVSLQPGPNNAPVIPDGGQIPAEDGRPEVDLDAVLNTLGPGAQRDLSRLVRASSRLISPEAERQANEGLHALNPALSQAARTAREISRDQAAFERFILASASVVSTVTSRRADLDQSVDNAAGAIGALAARADDLDRTLVKLPDTLRSGNTTLVNLRAALRDLDPMLEEARPAAPLVSEFLGRLSPFARAAIPIVERTQRTVDRPGSSEDLLGVVRGFPGLESAAAPAFRSATQTLTDALPVARMARPYTPDVIGGLVNGFGGTTTGYYDANGHYARISFQGSPYSLNNAASLVPAPPTTPGLAGYRKGVIGRCPGAAAQPAEDKSNPYKPEGHACRTEATPR